MTGLSLDATGSAYDGERQTVKPPDELATNQSARYQALKYYLATKGGS